MHTKITIQLKRVIHCEESQENASILTHKIHWKQHCTNTTADFWAGYSTDFLGNHLGKYHFTTKKEKEASTECNTQTAPATWQPACMEKQNTSAVLQIRASSHCQGICKPLKEAVASRPCLKLAPY